MAKKKRSAGIKTLGLLIDWTDSPYHISLFGGVREGARQLGLNMLTFVGGCLDSPKPFEKLRNGIYNYVTPESVDGVIVATSVGIYVRTDAFNRYCQRFSPLPVVSIAQKLDVAVSIINDCKPGLGAVLHHLIHDHGYRRLAMIMGPQESAEAKERFRVYRHALRDHGLTFDASLTVQGTFFRVSGYYGAKELWRKRGARPDAIVAANDEMAIGAIHALRELKLRVPQDIAVVGFDDQALSRYFDPPLTTVRQSIYHQGLCAVRALDDLLCGRHVEDTLVISSEAVLRQSCGCAQSHQEGNSIAPTAYELSSADKLGGGHQVALVRGPSQREVTRVERARLLALVERFWSCVERLEPADIGALVDELQRWQAAMEGEGDEVWQRFAVEVPRQARRRAASAANAAYASLLLDHMRVRLIERREQALLLERVRSDENTIGITEMGERLHWYQTMDETVEYVVDELPGLKVGSCYLSLFQGDDDPKARLVVAFRDGVKVPISARLATFPKTSLLPRGIVDRRRRRELVAELICFGSMQLGLVLLDCDEQRGVLFAEMRRVFLRIVLKNVVQLHRIETQAAGIKKANDELQIALQQLKGAQAKLIQSEKMSALGGLVAGISHEINTPLGVSVTAASHLAKVTQELQALYATDQMRRQDLERYVQTAAETSEMILSNLRRSHELIRSFKQVAVDQSTETKRRFNVREYVEQVLLSLRPTLKKTALIVKVKCAPSLGVVSYPGALSQIITNLIMNSVMHAYREGERGKISIEASVQDRHMVLRYADDGRGIKAAICGKIFDPFFTTKRGHGGTGLGLNIVYNLVCQTLGGAIKVSSAVGKGAVFTMTFPVR